MIKRGLVLVTFVSSVAFFSSADAKLFKWVDKDGTTHYGEVIPPEYADRDSQTLSSKGQLKQRSEKFDPELQRTNKEAAERKMEDDAIAVEQKRHDNTLLNTYSNEKEIDLARDRNLQLLDARVNSFSTMVKSAQDTFDGHNKEIADLNKAGKKPPKFLLDDAAASESRLDRLKKDLDQSKQEVVTVKARFDADKARYRELKGGGKK